MRSTTNYALPYPESQDHTRTWEYWQSLAEAVDGVLNGAKFAKPFLFAGHPAAQINAPNNTVIACDQVTVNKGPFTVNAAGLTVPVKGIYGIRFRALVAHSGSAQCALWVKTAAGAGVAYSAEYVPGGSNWTTEAAAPLFNLNAGDVLKCYATYLGGIFPVDTPSNTVATELTVALVYPT